MRYHYYDHLHSKGVTGVRNIIIENLKRIEESENVRILMAVESGSRAWGFASPDSDYDVRFIYARPTEEYLRLDEQRDVIELPINDMLDINGWDINKTLRLLYRSNPTLCEWASSPIIYMDNGFVEVIRPLLPKYFHSKKGLYHYLSMAKSNSREYLKSDVVKAKKYFYVLRPILACKWILDKHSPPPMPFDDLVAAELDPALKPEIDRLLDIKMNAPELKLIPRIDTINHYLDESIEAVELALEQVPDEERNDWNELNRLFLEIIKN